MVSLEGPRAFDSLCGDEDPTSKFQKLGGPTEKILNFRSPCRDTNSAFHISVIGTVIKPVYILETGFWHKIMWFLNVKNEIFLLQTSDLWENHYKNKSPLYLMILYRKWFLTPVMSFPPLNHCHAQVWHNPDDAHKCLLFFPAVILNLKKLRKLWCDYFPKRFYDKPVCGVIYYWSFLFESPRCL